MSIDAEFAVRRDIRNRAVVREFDVRQRREFRGIVLLACLTVALLLFSAWEHYDVVRHGYEIEKLRVDIQRAETVNRQLRLNLEVLRAPQVIERRARAIGLRAPSDADTIVLERTTVPSSSPTLVAMSH